MTPAAHVVHVCAGCGSVRVTSHHTFLRNQERTVTNVSLEAEGENVRLPECLNNRTRGGWTGLEHKAPF